MNWAPLAVRVLKSWLLDAPLGHLPAGHSDKILCLIPWILLEGHPNMGRDRTRSQRLPKLQCRHSHGPHITALSPSTTEASPHHSDRKVMLIFGTLKHHLGTLIKYTQNIHDLVKNLPWAQSSPWDFVLLKGHRTRSENFVYVAQCGVQMFGTCQECSLQTALEPSHCDFMNFFCISFHFSLKGNLHHRQQWEAKNSEIPQI